MSQISKCPSEEEWYSYLLDSDKGNNIKFGDHLQICEFCRFLVKELKSEITDIQNTWENISSPYIISMIPWQVVDETEEPSTSVLAAEGGVEKEETLSYTFSSPDKKYILHILRDPDSKDVWLYLKSENQAECKNIMIKTFKDRQSYVTDDFGRINLGPIECFDQDDLNAEVILPKAKFKLLPSDELLESNSVALLDSPDGDQIQVSLEGEGRNRRLKIKILKMSNIFGDAPLRVAVCGSKASHLCDVANRETQLDSINISDEIEIYLFQ